MKILFHENQLSYRGTSVALFDYAFFNRTLLGNESVVVYPKNHPGNFQPAIERFAHHFQLFAYEDGDDLRRFVRRSNADLLYKICGGQREDLDYGIKTAVHAVFGFNEPHGDVYAYVSQWLAEEVSGGTLPFVPHMVHLPDCAEDLRDTLGIPADATVFGRYGGSDSFDIGFVRETVLQIAERYPQRYFLFMGTDCFVPQNPFRVMPHNIIFLPANDDPLYKVRFINSCDALLHARARGETFGLSCGEFSLKNRPVITWGGSPERSHLAILGERALVYHDSPQLAHILANFDRLAVRRYHWDAYSEAFNPAAVMQQFCQVFIDG